MSLYWVKIKIKIVVESGSGGSTASGDLTSSMCLRFSRRLVLGVCRAWGWLCRVLRYRQRLLGMGDLGVGDQGAAGGWSDWVIYWVSD